MMKRILFAALLASTVGAAHADPRKPLILKNGQLQQVQPGDIMQVDVPTISTVANPVMAGTLFGPGDGISMTSDLYTMNLTGTRTKSQIAKSIYINDAQTGAASGPGVNTATTATYGQSIYIARPNWPGSTLTGEIDGMNVALRQSNGDVAGGLFNIGVRNGFAAVLESFTFSADSTGTPVKGVRTQTGVINNRDGGEFGFLTNAEKGTNLTAGVMVQSTPGTGATWQYLYKGLNPDAVRVFSVSGITGAIHSGDPSGWLETYRPNALGLAQIAGVSVGMNGVLGASRSSGNAIDGNMGTIGVQAFAINDNTAHVQSAYATYIEATKMPGAGTTHAIEFDIVNRGLLVQIDPHLAQIPDGITPGIWAASGGEVAANPGTAALVTVNNGAKWDKGVVFLAGSLVTRGDAKQEAISMGLRDAITFYGANRNVIGNIYGNGSGDGNTKTDIVLGGGNAGFTRADGSFLLNVLQSGATQYRSTTFAAVGPCNSSALGSIAFISDASTPISAWNQVVSAGGGSTATFIKCDGSLAWRAF